MQMLCLIHADLAKMLSHDGVKNSPDRTLKMLRNGDTQQYTPPFPSAVLRHLLLLFFCNLCFIRMQQCILYSFLSLWLKERAVSSSKIPTDLCLQMKAVWLMSWGSTASKFCCSKELKIWLTLKKWLLDILRSKSCKIYVLNSKDASSFLCKSVSPFILVQFVIVFETLMIGEHLESFLVSDIALFGSCQHQSLIGWKEGRILQLFAKHWLKHILRKAAVLF